MAGTSYDAHGLRLENLIQECEQMQQDADNIVHLLFETATSCHELGDESTGEIDKVKQALKKVLLDQNQVRTRAHGLKGMRGKAVEDVREYVENFPANQGSQWYNLEQHSEKWKEFEHLFCQGDGGAGADEAAAQEIEDEGIAIVPTQQQGIAPNKHCPLSGVPILQLKDPVRDIKGYIYEKEALAKYLSVSAANGRPLPRARGVIGEKKCPVAGAGHTVRWRDLKSAAMQIKSFKRQEKARQTQNQTQNDTDVLDL
jgi:hypothetical protein